MKISLLISILLCLVLTQADPLPNYIKPCKITDEQCIIENGNLAWQKLIFGDKDFQIPVLTPVFELNEVKVDLNPNFFLHHTNIKMNSAKSYTIRGAKYKSDENKLAFTLFNPLNDVDSLYEIKLIDFLGKDINGKGTFKLDIINANYTFDVYLKTITKESVDYLNVDKTTFDFLPEKISFKFANLFDGDVTKGEDANLHIENHWREFYEEVRTSYSAVMANLVKGIFDSFLNKIPKTELFLN
ncbi:protein takeout-like [Onthophagus taurus]|uniref:protein takeout-like n=1 Tax=Onthophagus taurus TaxID=166361 RepID=UPI000C207147|nr:uncharacterized protein LOC111416923 [Onthophagus taurus]